MTKNECFDRGQNKNKPSRNTAGVFELRREYYSTWGNNNYFFL